MRLCKWLDSDRRSCHGGEHTWEPGEWVETEGPLALCERGTLHLCRARDLVYWISPVLWEAEYEGEIVEGDDKVGVLRARITRPVEAWNEQAAREFACDCAERVLPVFEARYPEDSRPREAIEVARRFARGEATGEELTAAEAAAGAAASPAASPAAWHAAWHAARDARDACDAARAAARAATWAARDAARDAWDAWDAARAAGTAACDAWDAARAAWAAGWAARAAWVAGDAGDAEREWQGRRLCELLGIEWEGEA